MSSRDNGSSVDSDDLPPFIIHRSSELTRPAPVRARDYWESLLRGRKMPAREDIQPRDVREILPYIGLVELVQLPDGAEDYAMRLAGGKIEEIFGSLRGKPLCQSLPPVIATRWRMVFDKVKTSEAPLAVTGRVGYENLRHLKYELFLAPLGADGQVAMMIGAIDIWPVA